MAKVSDAIVESASGAVGSIIALLATYPLKTIYTLQALDQGGSGSKPGILQIILRYKLSGLYVGIEPNIVESGLSSGVYFYLYSKLREFAVKYAKQKAPAGSNSTGSSKDQDIGVLASFIVPALAAVGNQLVTMPASVIATRMQASKKAHVDGKTRGEAPGVGSIIRAIFSESGLGGFWAGLLPSLVLISNPSIQFALYEQFIRALKAWKRRRQAAQDEQDKQPSTPPADDLPARTSCSGVPSPLGNGRHPARTTPDGEVVHVEHEISTAISGSNSDSSGWHDPASPRRDSHERGLGKPVVNGQQVLSACPEALNGLTDTPKHNQAAVPAPVQPPPIRLAAWETFLCSALSKIGATLATYWLVVVKSRMQAASKSMPKDQQYKGTFDALIRMWREEGIEGFFKGLPAKLVQTALNAALQLMLKEQIYLATRKVVTEGFSGFSSRKTSNLVA